MNARAHGTGTSSGTPKCQFDSQPSPCPDLTAPHRFCKVASNSRLVFAMSCKPAFAALLLLLSAGHSAVHAQAASLQFESPATIGAKLAVRWEGPGEQYDLVTVDLPAAADDAKALNSASIISGRNPVEVVMPDEPGQYQLRYYSRSAKAVIGRAAIEVVDVKTTLQAPERAQMGSPIDIAWTGPGNSYERIELHSVGAPAGAKALASATVLGKSPLRMNLPELLGEHELRYVTRQSGRVLATRAISLFGVAASLQAPEQAQVGESIQIRWEGPGNSYDVISLHPVGAPADGKAVASASIVSKQNPVPMRLPEQAGAFELRYQTARSAQVLASRPIHISAVAASLDAPERATAGTLIEVRWEGPGNNYDRVGVFELDADNAAKALTHAVILNAKNPLDLKLPANNGSYELRYRTAQSGQVLARRAIEVEPAGRLSVVFEREGQLAGAAAGGGGAVELILDASGSMLQRVDGVRRIEIARKVLEDLVRNHLPEQTAFALRVFGHKVADQCRTDLEIPLQALNRDAAAATIAKIDAMNLAKTPIADSLAKVPSDLAGATGPRTVVLVTDGEETCDGDPAQVIKQLRNQGLDVQLSIVGFAIDDPELKSTFQDWAELGGGSYFDAASAEQLARSLRSVISGPFRVLDRQRKVVAQGIIGGAPVILPAGNYRVETIAPQPRVIEQVVVRAGELTEAVF